MMPAVEAFTEMVFVSWCLFILTEPYHVLPSNVLVNDSVVGIAVPRS